MTILSSLTLSAEDRSVHSPSNPWFSKKRQDPHFMMLYEELLKHVEKADKFKEELRAPDFPPEKEWFNSPPLSFERELKGKVIVLDFWTYCCINCIHILPDLAALEEQYSGYPVAFIGVHSAKFDNEKVSENIRQAVLRYDIHHPVINDDEMFLWRQLEVRSWPSLLVVGPEANLLLRVSGEGQKDVIDACIAAALSYYPPESFRHDPIPIALEKKKKLISSPWRFPGKLAVDPKSGRLFVSDSNHHRIVITDLRGKFIDSVGTGRVGMTDGPFDKCAFNRLQGLTFDDPYLYVADAENHALRRVDLNAKTVMTLAGNGQQGNDRTGGKSGFQQSLSTPWDVVVHKESVFIAMAGTHQIWQFDIRTGVCSNYSGDGSERNLNSTDRLTAAWAQPSGLTVGAGQLFVADSESSSIRAIDLASGATRTIVGADEDDPRNLFAFGDKDGIGADARLQHPLGVVWLAAQKRVAVADTYNHRIKLVDPQNNRAEGWAGTGIPGFKDGPLTEAQFAEPSGFALSPDQRKLFVADTNNHAIRVIDLTTNQVSTLEVTDVPPPVPPVAPRTLRLTELPGTPTIRIKTLKLAPGSEGQLTLRLKLPDGAKYAPDARSRWQILASNDSPVSIREQHASGTLGEAKDVTIPFTVGQQKVNGIVEAEALAYFCRDSSSCQLGAVRFEVPIEVGETAGASTALLEHTFSDRSGGFNKLLEPPTLPKKKPKKDEL